jgi:hypothetical protein
MFADCHSIACAVFSETTFKFRLLHLCYPEPLSSILSEYTMISNRPSSLLPSWRHTSNPSVSSPLHNMLPPQNLDSTDTSSPPLDETPTRSRSVQKSRPRGESRSSSVPVLNIPRQTFDSTDQDRKTSVKHLTCFWWKEKGQCKYSDEDCLYAHYDTVSHT